MDNDISLQIEQTLIQNNIGKKEPDLSTIDQCSFIKQNINKLSKQSKIKILKLISINNCFNHMQNCHEGIVLDLDKLPPLLISNIYKSTQFYLSHDIDG